MRIILAVSSKERNELLLHLEFRYCKLGGRVVNMMECEKLFGECNCTKESLRKMYCPNVTEGQPCGEYFDLHTPMWVRGIKGLASGVMYSKRYFQTFCLPTAFVL